MTLDEYKRRFEGELRSCRDFFLAKHRVSWMREQCLPLLPHRDEVLDTVEERVARSVLGPDFFTPQDGS